MNEQMMAQFHAQIYMAHMQMAALHQQMAQANYQMYMHHTGAMGGMMQQMPGTQQMPGMGMQHEHDGTF